MENDSKACGICKCAFNKPAHYSPARWSKRVYCSRQCQTRASTTKILINCATCDKQYLTHRYRLSTYKQSFCSRPCKFQDAHSTLLHLKNPRPFLKDQVPWNLGVAWSNVMKLKMSTSRLGKLIGADNPAWRGGTTPLLNKIRRLVAYKEWQRAVMRRDDFTCRSCQTRGVVLTAHHLQSLAYLVTQHKVTSVEAAVETTNLWNIDNGITLCNPCHEETPNYTFKAITHPIDETIYA